MQRTVTAPGTGKMISEKLLAREKWIRAAISSVFLFFSCWVSSEF
jgi:hypothetical protein